MTAFITKLFLHPLFRFFFWLGVAIWLILLGIFHHGWVRWINILISFIAIGKVIENAILSVARFRKDP